MMIFGYFIQSLFNGFSLDLFTCGTLVVLKLTNVSLAVADVKFPVSFPFLKTLHLRWVIYLDHESPQKLLSSCQILEVLVLYRQIDDNVRSFSITVPSLQKLSYINGNTSGGRFALNAPSLKCLEISDLAYECMVEKMPEIVAANVEFMYWNTDNFLGSLTSLKRPSICLPSESWRFLTGNIFHRLVDLEFCTCDTEWDLLMSLVKHSPKLRSLKLNERHNCDLGGEMFHWDEPSSVPETLMFGLESLEWKNYKGWNIEKELATFILKHSYRLNRASFSLAVTTTLKKKHRMLTELTLLPRGSTTCQLVFD